MAVAHNSKTLPAEKLINKPHKALLEYQEQSKPRNWNTDEVTSKKQDSHKKSVHNSKSSKIQEKLQISCYQYFHNL